MVCTASDRGCKPQISGRTPAPTHFRPSAITSYRHLTAASELMLPRHLQDQKILNRDRLNPVFQQPHQTKPGRNSCPLWQSRRFCRIPASTLPHCPAGRRAKCMYFNCSLQLSQVNKRLDILFASPCAGNEHIRRFPCNLGSHVSQLSRGKETQVAWLNRRLSGYIRPNC